MTSPQRKLPDPGDPPRPETGSRPDGRQPGPQSAGLRRDMEVLRELASEECLRRNGLGVVRIAERLGRDKSQVSRALRALEAEGLVERDWRTRTYQLGWGLYTLAARGVETRLVRAASAHLYRLADDQRADVRLSVLIGGQVLTLISVPNVDAVRYDAPTQTPSGPVLALDWSYGALRDLVPSGADDYDSLVGSVAQARSRGFVHFPATDSEPDRYAAPVRDFRGIVIAAIQLTERRGDGIAQPPSTTRIPADQALVTAAGALSADLGFDR